MPLIARGGKLMPGKPLRHLFPMSPLESILHDSIARSPQSRITFSYVMQQALYHPEHGYYGPGPRRIGRSGDFYTAVSVGPLYGQLLARLGDEVTARLGNPADFGFIEQAAHDGQLAEDILSSSPYPYFIVEPNERYEAVQRQRLAQYVGRVKWVSSLAELPHIPALFLSNELPDAMPVHVVQWDGSKWEELYVRKAGETLEWEAGEPSPQLDKELQRLPQDLEKGYTTEVHLASLEWMREVGRAAFYGEVYIADYGFDEHEFYSPERTRGTLRRYLNHQTDDRVLENLGAADLTTHINFSRLIETAETAGMAQRTYELQGRYLGKLGLPILAQMEGRVNKETQAVLRQYHSLTHPAFMGRSFRILTLSKPA
jgi:SAM-dependent MidA family methyltransferase